LLKDLATTAANRVQPLKTNLPVFTVITTPTPIQRRAFELLGVSHRSATRSQYFRLSPTRKTRLWPDSAETPGELRQDALK